MKKTPFLTLEQAKQIIEKIPTPFHIYDEAGIRNNARELKQAFSWNPGFREYFAVKATPNPHIMKLLLEEGCGCDCSSYTELLLAEVIGLSGEDNDPTYPFCRGYLIGEWIVSFDFSFHADAYHRPAIPLSR